MNRSVITGLVALLLLLSACVGYVYGQKRMAQESLASVAECHRTFDLLDQNIDCVEVEEVGQKVSTLEKRVSTLIEDAIAEKKVHRASVFYRDLNTRRWFGVNADDQYYPASLAKLPLAVTYYKVADLEPIIFDQTLVLGVSDAYSNKNQKVSVDSPMVTGQSYAVRRMVEDMLIYSDNRPIGPLINYMRPDVWKKVYADLGVRRQLSDGTEDWSVSPRTFALIFRSIYNGSYLDLGSSQEILNTLSKARYAGGLSAGVPSSVRIAHKFGEATIVEDGGDQVPVLHDCGIVYKPGEPYILCVMTEGKDFASLEHTIAEISETVFDAS